MNISFDKFEKWANARFGEENVLVKNNKEIRINTIFEPDDSAYHLWCSPSGGKKKRESGVFHCFKTDKKGTLVKLVQIVDHCDREDAIATLQGKTSIYDLEKRLEEILNEQDNIVPEPVKSEFTLPPACQLISDLGTNNWWHKKAEEYLTNRKIPIDGLYICIADKYKSRIIIPYYDRSGKLIYWNGRHMGKSKCKYLGPPKEVGVGKEDVVFMAGKWPKSGETVYVCEGEFNAKTLQLAEFHSAACGGKNMSEKQAIMLADYKIVLCLDRDKAGRAGTTKMTSMVSSFETVKKAGDKLSYVMPPDGYNDWNEFIVKNNAELLHYFILQNRRSLDFSGPLGTVGDYFGFRDI